MPKLKLSKERRRENKPKQPEQEISETIAEAKPEAEAFPERLPAERETGEKQEAEIAEKPSAVPVAPAPPAEGEEKSKTLSGIEKVLEEDMLDYYYDMPEEKRQDFKEKGEKTASKIEKLLSKTKIQVNKIFNLIKKWLNLIPGVSRLFLDKEAKIKTDKILAFKRAKDEKDKNKII